MTDHWSVSYTFMFHSDSNVVDKLMYQIDESKDKGLFSCLRSPPYDLGYDGMEWRDDTYKKNGHDWCWKHWGTKWDVYPMEDSDAALSVIPHGRFYCYPTSNSTDFGLQINMNSVYDIPTKLFEYLYKTQDIQTQTIVYRPNGNVEYYKNGVTSNTPYNHKVRLPHRDLML